jgi:hypothetical protein
MGTVLMVGGPRGILDGLRRGPGPQLGRDGRMGTVLRAGGPPQCPQGRLGGGRCAAQGCVICSPAPASIYFGLIYACKRFKEHVTKQLILSKYKALHFHSKYTESPT